MLTITARIRREPAALREATAWFIPGADPLGWLREVARWPVDTEQVAFFVMPDGASGDVAGVLALPPRGTSLPRPLRAQPYAELAPGWFAPVDARLFPPLAPGELSPGGFVLHVWHPALGLVGFEEHERRHAWDFLAAPAFSVENWSAAVASPPARPRLKSVRLIQTLLLADVFGEESRDIGSEAPEDLPPSPGEPGKGMGSRIVQGASAGLIKALLGLAALVPRGAVAPTWVNKLENWAGKKLGSLMADLERSRHQELHRLMEMMKNNPDEGLRHAISLAALAHRGKAPPSGKLAQRPLDFDLRRLGGGGAGDAWTVPADVQSSLAKSYREAAQREAALGRHRRAACIYAELLGDFPAAADALKQGKHFVEAALIYRERLNKPLLAAECLAAGGLVREAIEIYEREKCWLELAALHEKLGDIDAARAALRRLVETHLAAHDMLAAARLLETRLAAPDEALAHLTAAWPGGRQSLACLEERLALLERLGRASDAAALCRALGCEALPANRVAAVVGVLVKNAADAKDAGVRRAAAEAVRVRASTALHGRLLERADELAVLKALTRLAPHDRLLTRDVNRFRDQAPPAIPVPRLRAPQAIGLIRRMSLGKGRSLSLPMVGPWIRVSRVGTGFGAVARQNGDKLFFTRGTWGGAQQSAQWADPAPEMGTALIFKEGFNSIVLARPFSGKLKGTVLSASDAFGREAVTVGTPDWVPEDVVQVTEFRVHLWAVRVVSGRVVLASFLGGEFKEARLLYSRDVTDELTAAGATGGGTSVSLEARGALDSVALGFGACLLVMNHERELKVCNLGSRVLGLIPLRESSPGWIVRLERGIAWVKAPDLEVTMLDEDMVAPLLTFTGGGGLVAIAGNEGKVFQRVEDRYVATGWFPWEGDPAPIAILGTDQPLEFAAFYEKGTAQRWTLPAS